MVPTPADRLARFARLPRNPVDVWQGALIRLPAWVENGPDGKPFRPNGAFCVSVLSGRINQTADTATGTPDRSLLLDCFVEFGLDRELAGCRPGTIVVTDENAAAYLREHLAGAGVTVTVSSTLPELTEILNHFGEHIGEGALPPNALDVPGITLDHLRAFAAAAKRFYQAAPWRHLSDEDLVAVENPTVPREVSHLTVLGNAGITLGIGFYESPDDFENILESDGSAEDLLETGHWSIFFGPIQELPFGDADAWQDHGLPVAGDDAYPIAAQFGPDDEIRRPNPSVLAAMEMLMLALADSAEADIDQGRWTKHVQTSSGEQSVTLSNAALLEPIEDPQAGTASALERAEEMVERAIEARGRRRIQLARKAAEISPDCADAYTLLAEEAYAPEEAIALYRNAVSAGERSIGPEIMQNEVGRFWGLAVTRPYMRALFGLGQCLEALDRLDEATQIYRDLLRLNPNDNQGVRWSLLPLLLQTGDETEAGTLLQQFAEDASALWQYGWALWLFRAEGDSPASRARLQSARRANRFVSDYLSGKSALPDELPDSYSIGDKEEAMLCADALLAVWRATPGAEPWLRTAATPKPKRPPKKPRGRR